MNQLQQYRQKKARQFAQNPHQPPPPPPKSQKKSNPEPQSQNSQFPSSAQQPNRVHSFNDYRQQPNHQQQQQQNRMHGFSDYQHNQDNQYEQQKYQQQGGFFNFNMQQQFPQQKPMYPQPPLPTDNGCKRCCFCFCPYFTIKSLSFILWMIVTVYAIIISSLVIHYDREKSDVCIYYLCGASYGAAVQQRFEFYRWIVPFFMHSSVFTKPFHYLFNTLGFLISGFEAEYFLGWKYYGLLLIPLQLSSALFSQNISNEGTVSLGASGVIVGLLAFHSMRLFLGLEKCNTPYGCRLIIFPIYAALSVINTSKGTDTWGHFGGLIGGLLFAPVFFYIPWKRRMEKKRLCNLLFSSIFLCLGICFIFTLIMTLFLVKEFNFVDPCH